MRGENNVQRRRRARRERMEPETMVRLTNQSGHTSIYPMRYLVPEERRRFLDRATSPL